MMVTVKRVTTVKPLILLVLCLTAGWLLLSTRPAGASSRFEPEVNNATFSATPTTTYKNTNFTLVDGVRFYTRFADINSYVSEATAYVYFYSVSGTETVEVYAVSAAYNADTLTWNTQPTIGAQITSVSVTAVGWYSFDITAYVNEHYGRDMAFVLAGNSSTSGSVVARSLPAADHIYIDYTPAPLTKPEEPAHCWNFDNNQDIFGNLDLTLNNGATVGQEVGVVDYGLGLPSAFFSDATFLSPYPAAGDISVSFWASGASSTQIEVGTTTSTGWKVSYIPNNYVQIYSDSSSATLGTVGSDDFVSVVWAGGVVTLTINTTTYTDTLDTPTPSNDTYQIYGDSGAVVDQLVIFTSALSSEEIAWLYRGGVGRSCGEWVPTALVTMPPVATPQYQIPLPSGGTADVFMQATAGELIIGFIGLLLSVLTIFALMLRWSNFMAKR